MAVATTRDGVQIQWDSLGAGLPLMLVHGVTQSRRLWSPIDEALAERFRVLRLDLRGHGESGRASDYSYGAMTEDVATVVNAAGVSAPIGVTAARVSSVLAWRHDALEVPNPRCCPNR